ncbi:MAG: hypothetical protein ACYSWP_02165 [Planctomycetota bacterium]|jgi:hypothetical protein
MEIDFYRDVLFDGMTANGFKLGTVLSLGWFWMRVDGCSVLYRGDVMDAIDFGDVLSVSEIDAEQMSVPSYVGHENDSIYFYVVRRFNSCGVAEQTLSTSVRVAIDSAGDLAEPRPNNLFAVKARQIDGNKVELSWYYCPLAQESEPESFVIYSDGGSGAVDFENSVATVDYTGRRFYSYTSGILDTGRYLFCIKVEDVSGQASGGIMILVELNGGTPGSIEFVDAESI